MWACGGRELSCWAIICHWEGQRGGPTLGLCCVGRKEWNKSHWCVAGASHRSAVTASADLAGGSAGKVVQEPPMMGFGKGFERGLKSSVVKPDLVGSLYV